MVFKEGLSIIESLIRNKYVSVFTITSATTYYLIAILIPGFKESNVAVPFDYYVVDQSDRREPSGPVATKSITSPLMRSYALFGIRSSEDETVVEKPITDIEKIPETELSLRLIGVFTHSKEARASAIIAVNGKTEYAHLGDELDDVATLVEIHETGVILNRDGQLEKLNFEHSKTDVFNAWRSITAEPSQSEPKIMNEDADSSEHAVVAATIPVEGSGDRQLRSHMSDLMAAFEQKRIAKLSDL